MRRSEHHSRSAHVAALTDPIKDAHGHSVQTIAQYYSGERRITIAILPIKQYLCKEYLRKDIWQNN